MFLYRKEILGRGHNQLDCLKTNHELDKFGVGSGIPSLELIGCIYHLSYS